MRQDKHEIFGREEGRWSLDEFVAMLRERAGDGRAHIVVEAGEEFIGDYRFKVDVQRPKTAAETTIRAGLENEPSHCYHQWA